MNEPRATVRRLAPMGLLCAATLAGGALVGGAEAQVVELGPVVLERVSNDRWVHEGQHDFFVPFQRVRLPLQLRVQSFGGNRPGRILQITEGGRRNSLSVDARGVVRTATVGTRRRSYQSGATVTDRREERLRTLRWPGAAFRLPASRYWDVPFSLPVPPLVMGLTWSDTLALVDDAGEALVESMTGTRDFHVVGDTVFDGRLLPLIRFEGRIAYEVSDVLSDWSHDEPLIVSRSVEGTVRGWAVVDTTRGVRALGADTLAMDGVSLLHLQDGRVLTSGASYERTQRWEMWDSLEWREREDSLRQAARMQRTGMLRLARNDVEERLRSGDTTVVDSLVNAWRGAADVTNRLRIEATLRQWIPDDEGLGFRDEPSGLTLLRSLRAEAGDSAFAVSANAGYGGPSARLTSASLDELLPYLADIERLWKLGLAPPFQYLDLAGTVLTATPSLEPDSSAWRCEPMACDRLREAARRADEPRFNDVALVADFARDPARFEEAVRLRRESGSRVVERAYNLSLGIVSRRADRAYPIPADASDWRGWTAWMGGTGRFEAEHRRAIEVFSARTGRDVVGELSASWPPTNDSAFVVVREVLQGMGALAAPTPYELADWIRSGSEAREGAAQRAIREQRWREWPTAPDDLALEMLLPSIDSALTLDRFHGLGSLPVFLIDTELPAGLADRLAGRVTVITEEAWRERSPRAGGVLLRVQSTRLSEPFLYFGWSWRVFERREADEAPSGYAGGTGAWLIRSEEGWSVVASSNWIT